MALTRMRVSAASLPVAVSLGCRRAGWRSAALARRTDRPAVGRTGPRHPAAARHLECQLAGHVIGARPFTTRRYDRATNLWPLALLSLGESWHNITIRPACARHGADPRQVDISAIVIRIFERLGWATGVHWPVPARLDRRRRDQGRLQAAPVLQDSEALIPPAPG